MKKSKGKKSKRLAVQPPTTGKVNPVTTTTVVSKTSEWSGPLPPPAEFQEFNDIVPGSAERILILAEKQQEHRQKMESAGLSATIKDTKRGQILGAAVSALAICGAIFAVYFGAHATVPIALVGVPLTAVIKALIDSRSN